MDYVATLSTPTEVPEYHPFGSSDINCTKMAEQPGWTTLETIRGDANGDANFTDFRDGPMCCAVTYVTSRNKTFCRICKDKGRNSSHEMVERRYRCKSAECLAQWAVDRSVQSQRAFIDDADDDDDALPESPCPVVWKVQECPKHSEWLPRVNNKTHLRGAIPCSIATTKLTEEMKNYASREDDIGIPPRLILVNMKTEPGIRKPKRGWPTAMQLANALKTLRRTQGKKNSVKAIQAYVCASPFYVGIPADEQFLFGTCHDNEGHAHVGSGEADDPFLLGVTSVRLIDDSLNFMSTGQFVMFHADATFKLSDLGYPVISCGFTDKKRSYQVAALFVVSRRTAADYAQCFGALARLFKEVRGRTIHVDAIMGDAEDAQVIAYASIPEFARATVLMCFFHVLYNVRKRVKHLPSRQRKMVFKGIVDMHFVESMSEFETTRNAVLAKWRSMSSLQVFAKYFEQQWLTGRFWRWQAFHTPSGYATTNNPCEVYNSSLKSFFQRRRWHMKKLLEKLRQHLDVQAAVEPVSNSYIAPPTTDVLDAASLLIQSRRVSVENTFSPACVRVCHVKTAAQLHEDDDDSESDDDDFDDIFEAASPLEVEHYSPDAPSTAEILSLVTAPEDEWKEKVRLEREREKASKLYSSVVKWSLRRSHVQGMPVDGWVVDVDRCICGCKFFVKFATCAHVAVGRSARNMTKPGVIQDKKLKSMIASKKVRAQKRVLAAKKKKAKAKALSQGKKAKTAKPAERVPNRSQSTGSSPRVSLQISLPAHLGFQTIGQPLLSDSTRQTTEITRGAALFSTRAPRLFAPSSQLAIPGRPLSASSALDIQFLMN